MLRYLPLILAFVAIGAVAVFDGVLNHRWTRNLQAEAYANLLDKVPEEFGPWKGESFEVNDDILRTAGAEGHVSRAYVHEDTGQSVKIWLIVGPFKHVIRHTPDICYPSQDFRFAEPISAYLFEGDKLPENQFLTSMFQKQGFGNRVFWSWHKPADSGEVKWFASTNKAENRETYAGTQALFKLYFTTAVSSKDATPDMSPANEFAAEFLPMLNDLIRAQRPGAAAEQPAPQDAQSDDAKAPATTASKES